ncbi:Dyp-type peroxidase [Nesterenkonia natronophila]|uniref:Dyp-type peroxidase n=1 Tax=Nesterenkonia natronophila TaxID=2174932 RepID=A0A3A4F863_9MICC|nr:Dyp-type peroxidase [Nesterenkonia natronophila]RJN31427.1 Dyp-type peroxidase [Nesterenkonia natronophila]
MTTDPERSESNFDSKAHRDLSRRGLLLGAGGTGLAATAAAAFGFGRSTAPAIDPREPVHGTSTIDFYGNRQAGIDTPAQAHAVLLALDLDRNDDPDAARRLLRLLSDDAARLTQGRPALADTEPELAETPARLTVTFGFGPSLVRMLSPTSVPHWLRDLPHFDIDRLESDLCGGDLLLQICGDDPVSVAHARRILLKDARGYGAPRWIQDGFRSSRGARPRGETMRNLFGQVDETVQPRTSDGSREFVVWGNPPPDSTSTVRPWITDGTSLVVRLISMDMDGWDELSRRGKESSIGRDLRVGAPLTGVHETDEPDFEETSDMGFPVIEEFAHIRRAHPHAVEEQILRRSYNYDRPPKDTDRISDTGQLFLSYQADVVEQFLPIQQRLAEGDRLNEWTTPIGSAVFAIPPGCRPGGYIGDCLT